MRSPQGRLELTWMGKDAALIPSEDGKYDYQWVDLTDPRAHEVKSIQVTDTIGDLGGPAGAEENLLIVGESGDALRSLGNIPEWREKYRNKIKLVYIDPPFNTGKVFDRYSDQLEHSVWLTMMRDRIRSIKPLMSKDASIWVHLDDSEVHRMRSVLDEEFGIDRFVTQIVWQKRTTRENRAVFSDNHDHLLVYSLMKGEDWREVRNRLPRTETAKNPDNDPRGPWDSIPFSAQGFRPNQMYEIVTPTGVRYRPPLGRCWGATESEYLDMLADNRIHFTKGGHGRPRVKQFIDSAPGLVPHTVWLASEVGPNDQAKKEIMNLFPGVNPFDTPKPERLLSRIIQIASNPGEIVLDCFAGSGTTAAVAHKMGRRWVTVELIENTVEEFTIPRLTKVVHGKDPGGITSLTERAPVSELPEGVTAEEAQRFTTLVGKFTEDQPLMVDLLSQTAKFVRSHAKSENPSLTEVESKALLSLLRKLSKDESDEDTQIDLMPEVRKTLRDAARTKNVTTLQWVGGGGFTVARVGPSMYEVDVEDGEIYLSEAATNGAFSQAVAGQLQFALTPDHPVFCGVKRRLRLAVVDGVADEPVIRTVVEHLGDGEKAVVVAKSVLPEAEQLLSELSPGSRLRKAPEDLFPKATVK